MKIAASSIAPAAPVPQAAASAAPGASGEVAPDTFATAMQAVQGTQGVQSTQTTHAVQATQITPAMQRMQATQGVQATQDVQATQGVQATQDVQDTQAKLVPLTLEGANPAPTPGGAEMQPPATANAATADAVSDVVEEVDTPADATGLATADGMPLKNALDLLGSDSGLSGGTRSSLANSIAGVPAKATATGRAPQPTASAGADSDGPVSADGPVAPDVTDSAVQATPQTPSPLPGAGALPASAPSKTATVLAADANTAQGGDVSAAAEPADPQADGTPGVAGTGRTSKKAPRTHDTAPKSSAVTRFSPASSAAAVSVNATAAEGTSPAIPANNLGVVASGTMPTAGMAAGKSPASAEARPALRGVAAAPAKVPSAPTADAGAAAAQTAQPDSASPVPATQSGLSVPAATPSSADSSLHDAAPVADAFAQLAPLAQGVAQPAAVFAPSLLSQPEAAREDRSTVGLSVSHAVDGAAGTADQSSQTAPVKRLEIAVQDSQFGTLDLRAEMRGSTVHATVTGSQDSAAASMPALHQFLQQHDVTLHSLAYETVRSEGNASVTTMSGGSASRHDNSEGGFSGSSYDGTGSGSQSSGGGRSNQQQSYGPVYQGFDDTQSSPVPSDSSIPSPAAVRGINTYSTGSTLSIHI